MSVIRHKLDRAIACTCGSTAVIDRRQHADDCLRGLWRDFTDEVDALTTTTEGAVGALDELRKAAESYLPMKAVNAKAERFRAAMRAASNITGGQSRETNAPKET